MSLMFKEGRRTLVRGHVNTRAIDFSKTNFSSLSVFSVIITINLNFSELGREAMVRENDEMPLGWPLGLSFLYTRLRIAESLPVAPVESYSSLHAPSSSFSSFSSSNLDTESSASFFQDNSVSLGRLIGIRAGERRGRLYLPNSLSFEESEKNNALAKDDDSKVNEQVDMSPGNVCIPILLDALLLKTSRSKRSSRN